VCVYIYIYVTTKLLIPIRTITRLIFTKIKHPIAIGIILTDNSMPHQRNNIYIYVYVCVCVYIYIIYTYMYI